MKLSLVVLNSGKSEGQSISIKLAQFLIGRDPQCNLRPNSPMISKRHCALLVRNGQVFVRDFNSTNGTFVNDQQVKGEVSLENQDILKVGPLTFRVQVEKTTPVDKPTPLPTPLPKSEESAQGDSMAAMLLSMKEDETVSISSPPSTSEMASIPTETTVMNVPVPPLQEMDQTAEKPAEPAAAKPPEKSPPPKKPELTGARLAAKNILEKFTKRRRS